MQDYVRARCEADCYQVPVKWPDRFAMVPRVGDLVRAREKVTAQDGYAVTDTEHTPMCQVAAVIHGSDEDGDPLLIIELVPRESDLHRRIIGARTAAHVRCE